MQKPPFNKKWPYVILLFYLAAGVVIGTISASGIYDTGRGKLAALSIGLICGCLGMGSIHLLLQAMLCCFGTAYNLRHAKTKMWGVIPEWLFLGVYGLLMVGGVALSVTGRITQNHVFSSIGDFALMIAFGIIGLLVAIGLCILGWKRILRAREID